jgi:hypothetical protein
MLPEDLKAHIPAILVTPLSVALLLLGLAGRLVRQRNPSRFQAERCMNGGRCPPLFFPPSDCA